MGSNAHVVVLHYDGYFDDYEPTVEKIAATEGVARWPHLCTPRRWFKDAGASVSLSKADLNETSVTDVRENLMVGPAGQSHSRKKGESLCLFREPPRAIAQLRRTPIHQGIIAFSWQIN